MDCKGCYPLLTTTPLNLTTFWKRLTGPLAQVLQWLLPTPTPSPPENISKKAHRPTSSWTERKVLLLDLRTFWKRLTGPLAHRLEWQLHTYTPSSPENISKEAHRPTSSWTARKVLPLDLRTLRKRLTGPLVRGLQWLLHTHIPSQPENILKEAHRPTRSWTAMPATYLPPLDLTTFWKRLTGPLDHGLQCLLHTYPLSTWQHFERGSQAH